MAETSKNPISEKELDIIKIKVNGLIYPIEVNCEEEEIRISYFEYEGSRESFLSILKQIKLIMENR